MTTTRTAWWVLVLIAAANFGNFYVYDSIGPVAELLVRQRGFSDTEIGLLNAVYSLPNIVLLLFGGLLVDRCGAARMLFWTGAICLAGALLTALGTGFPGMAAGRFLFGVGAETFNICTIAAIVKYFFGRHLGLAIAASIALGRAGAYAVDLSPTWMPGAYADGWQPPLLVAALFALFSFLAAAVYWRLDRDRVAVRTADDVAPRVRLADIAGFGRAYWSLVGLCALWYAVIFAFRSTFAIKYFQHVHGLELDAAGKINGDVFLAALFATPLLGWLSDRIGRHEQLLAFGALMLPLSIAALATPQISPWIGTVMIGLSFSLVPAVLWPLTARIVPPERLGTALGVMWSLMSAAIAGANYAAGWLNDRYGAGELNPAGYEPMMTFFLATATAGFVLALLQLRPLVPRSQPES